MNNFIKIYRWSDAPEYYRQLSPHGGDEDWIAILPASYKGEVPDFLESGSRFGCCDVSEHSLMDGRKVLIGAHA